MRILPLGDRHEPDGVALFFEVDEATLDRISGDPEYYRDRALVDSCFKQRGRNAHLYLLVNNGDIKVVIRKLRFLMDQYDTVSWWTVEHRKFYIRRKKIC